MFSAHSKVPEKSKIKADTGRQRLFRFSVWHSQLESKKNFLAEFLQPQQFAIPIDEFGYILEVRFSTPALDQFRMLITLMANFVGTNFLFLKINHFHTYSHTILIWSRLTCLFSTIFVSACLAVIRHAQLPDRHFYYCKFQHFWYNVTHQIDYYGTRIDNQF